jgi:hypothetical protein
MFRTIEIAGKVPEIRANFASAFFDNGVIIHGG